MKRLIDVQGKFSAMRRVAAASGLRLEQNDECTQPMTDMKHKVVYMPSLSSFMDEDKAIRWDGYGYHECGHHHPDLADMAEMMLNKKIAYDSLFGRLLNVAEDIRNEALDHGLYIGRDRALSYTQSYHALEGAEMIEKHGYENLDPDMQVFSDALGLAYKYRGETFQPGLALNAAKYAGVTRTNDYLHLLPMMDFITAENCYQWVLEFLNDHGRDPEEEEQKSREKFESNPEGSEGEGGKSESSDSRDGDDGEGQDGETAKGEVSYSDLLAHDHSSKVFGKPGSSVTILYDHEARHDFVPSTSMEVVTNPKYVAPSYEINKFFEEGRYLSGAAKRLFQSMTQKAKMGSQDEGKLDRAALWKVPSGSREVFYKQRQRVDPSATALYLLTDSSGSMAGDAYDLCAAAVTILNDALSPLHLAIKISTFTEFHSGPYHVVMKGWNEAVNPDKLMGRYTAYQHRLEQNSDGESVLWAGKDLLTRPEPRKILLVMSDGQPASWRPGDAATHLKRVIESFSGQCELYGFGMMDNSVKEFYPEFTYVRKPTDLNQALLDVIKRKIIV